MAGTSNSFHSFTFKCRSNHEMTPVPPENINIFLPKSPKSKMALNKNGRLKMAFGASEKTNRT